MVARPVAVLVEPQREEFGGRGRRDDATVAAGDTDGRGGVRTLLALRVLRVRRLVRRPLPRGAVRVRTGLRSRPHRVNADLVAAVRLRDPAAPLSCRADAADRQRVALQATDHVHVDHRHGLHEGARRVRDVITRTDQALLLASERDEQDGAPHLLTLLREEPREFK